MRTVNFRDDVLWAVAYKLGLDPSTDLLVDQASALTSFINIWVSRLYDKFDWPEWTVTEERTPVNHYVDFDQAGLTPIGRVYKVYLLNPDTTRGPLDTFFRLGALGVHVGFDHGTTVFIKFTKRAPKFTAVVWDSTVSYAIGDLVYDPVSGNVYSGVTAANIAHAVTLSANWTLVPFPFALADPVVRGAYSDALREEGQTDKGMAEEQAAGQAQVERAATFAAPDYDPLTGQQPAGVKRYQTAGT